MSNIIKSATDSFKSTKRELDVISPTMCAAKWQQVTIHLGNGTTHSCHHPKVHPIPLEELEHNPTALHNTQFKKEQRKSMLEGIRPDECDYCWRVEDTPKKDNEGEVYSDRIIKSSEDWSRPHLQTIKVLPWDTNINPSYMEVDFDTTCNFKCAYCSPLYSTTWMQEIKQHGPYKLPTGMIFNSVDNLKRGQGLPILQSEDNPYVDAFWKWWPDAVRDLHTFRITGGEPLLSKNTFKVLDYLIDNPQPQMEFNINSNLGAPKEIIDKFFEKISIIQDKKAVKEFKLFTSNEAHGKRAEYIRFGLKYDYWLSNLDRFLKEVPNSKATLMCTYNLLSVTSFTDFLKDMLDLKLKYSDATHRQLPLSVDIPYLRHPDFLAAWLLTENFHQQIADSVSFMMRNQQYSNWYHLAAKGFYDYEIHRMERLYYLVLNEIKTKKPSFIDQRKNFASFVDTYDARRGTNFLDTFPELEEFYKYCKYPYHNED